VSKLPYRIDFGVIYLIRFVKVAVLLLLISLTSMASYLIDINIPEYTLRLYENDLLINTFPIAVGKSITPSILGDFKIVTIVKNPTWYPQGKDAVPPGPENPLGPWWLGLDYPSYGIHGNNAPSSIGKAQSKGCIRMRNDDVEYLAGKVQKGTQVRLRYEPIVLIKGSVSKFAVYDDLYNLEYNTASNLRRIAKENGIDALVPDWVLTEFIKLSQGKAYQLPKPIDIKVNGQLSGYGYEITNEIVLPLVALKEVGLSVTNDNNKYYIDGKPLQAIVGKGVNFAYKRDLERLLWLRFELSSNLSLSIYNANYKELDLGRVLYLGDYLFNASKIADEIGSTLYLNPATNAAMIDGQVVISPHFYNDQLYLTEAQLADYLALGINWDAKTFTAKVESWPIYLWGQRFADDGYLYNRNLYLPLTVLESLGYVPDWVDRITERVKIGETILMGNKARGDRMFILSDDFAAITGWAVNIESASIYLEEKLDDTNASQQT